MTASTKRMEAAANAAVTAALENPEFAAGLCETDRRDYAERIVTTLLDIHTTRGLAGIRRITTDAFARRWAVNQTTLPPGGRTTASDDAAGRAATAIVNYLQRSTR